MSRNYGGMSSIDYKLAKNKLVTGFGNKKYGRGEEDINEEQIKRPRGRPSKFVEPEEDIYEEEEELQTRRSRGRPTRTHTFNSNLVDNLNGVLSGLQLEQAIIKKNTMDWIQNLSGNKCVI